ncbi:MAG: GNAT family N-acetyltransferase [Acidimicrobiia bacterium]|nr:GNAT family N-acetyltransferase [Acidimicrobiia bacterium]
MRSPREPPTGAIRPYDAPDVEELIDAWYEASLVAHSFLPAEFFVAERDLLRTEWLPVAETYVFEQDGRVVGFIALVGDEVGGIFVRPDHQGEGIGSALMDHAVALRETLELDVFEENAIGRRFYDGYGYGFEFISVSHEPTTGRVQHRLRLAVTPD